MDGVEGRRRGGGGGGGNGWGGGGGVEGVQATVHVYHGQVNVTPLPPTL